MDHGARTTRETIQVTSGKRSKETTTSAGQKDPRRPLLPASFRACGDGDTPETVRKDRNGRLLVVYEWGAKVKTPSVHTVPIVDGAAAKALEGCGGGEWEHPRTPPVRLLRDVRATEAVLELLRTTRVGCIGVGRVPPEDRGEDMEGEEGGLGPP